LEFMLFQVIFPLLCLKDDDLELFESDPHEFIRKANDPMEDYFDPKLSAINVMIDFAKLRTKDALPMLLGFLTETLNAYAQSPPEQRNYRKKDGALVALGALDDILKKKKKFRRTACIPCLPRVQLKSWLHAMSSLLDDATLF